ncbi:MAG: PD40 domain-containing protein, partial [Planctomycetes bacterium]|nr:PD40 domain-containing protein [Planctomycetota bacterium]
IEGEESLTLSGDMVGTPLYMSPEQARRKKIPIDHRTDVYSLGATLYEMLILRPPFRGKDNEETLSQIIERDPVEPRKLNRRIPKDLETIVLKCLRKDPAGRYGTAEALAQDLRRFARGDPVEARPPTTWELWVRRVYRHRRKLLLAAGVSILLLALGALAWRLRIERETSRLYLAQDYEKKVVAAAMKLLRSEWVLSTKNRGGLESADLLPRRYQDLLSGSGKRVAEEAVAELTAEIAALPDRFEGYHYRAKGLSLLGNDAGGIADLQECLRRNPGFLPAKALLSELEAAGNQTQAAPLSKAIDPGDRWGGAWLRAHVAMKNCSWKDAAAAYTQLLSMEESLKRELFLGSSIENLLGRGVVLMETRDFEGAKRDFWAARTLSQRLWGDFLEPLLLLGKSYLLEGNPERAEELFHETLERSGDRDRMALWIAAAYQSLLLKLEISGRTGEAVAAARKALQFYPDDNAAQIRLGWALIRDRWSRRQATTNRTTAAEPEIFQEIETLVAAVLAKNPNDPSAYALLSKSLEAQGKLDLASELSEKAEALLGGADLSTLSRRQDMNQQKFKSMTAVAGTLFLALGIEGRAHEISGTFKDVKRLGDEFSSPYIDGWGVPSGDGLTLAFFSSRPGGNGSYDMYIADRPDTAVPFTEVRNIAELNTSEWEIPSFLSDDGLTLYYHSDTSGNLDLYFARRKSRDGLFEAAQPVEGLNTQYFEGGLSLTADGLEAFFLSDRPGGRGLRDIWVATRGSVNMPFQNVRNLKEVNTIYAESAPSISADGLTLFWSDSIDGFDPRPGGKGGTDIWCATRATRDEPFGKAVNLGSPINTGAEEYFPRISPRWPEDGSIIYFTRNLDIYQATWRVTPPVRSLVPGDCNGDGALDVSDAVCILGVLFIGEPKGFPCGDGASSHPGNVALLDWPPPDGQASDGQVDVTDVVNLLTYLFIGGSAHPLAVRGKETTEPVPIPGCSP